MQIFYGFAQLAADGAAEAAGLQQHHGVVDALQQMMIEADLAELVDQHCRVAERRIGEQALQQGRLAGAEKARDQIDGREGRSVSHFPPPAGRGTPDRADRRAGPKASRRPPRDG